MDNQIHHNQNGQTLLWIGLLLIVASVLVPVIWYFVETASCSPSNGFCGFGSAYAATYIGVPGFLFGLVLLGVGLYRRKKKR